MGDSIFCRLVSMFLIISVSVDYETKEPVTHIGGSCICDDCDKQAGNELYHVKHRLSSATYSLAFSFVFTIHGAYLVGCN